VRTTGGGAADRRPRRQPALGALTTRSSSAGWSPSAGSGWSGRSARWPASAHGRDARLSACAGDVASGAAGSARPGATGPVCLTWPLASELLAAISRAVGHPPRSIFTVVKHTGGYAPRARSRRAAVPVSPRSGGRLSTARMRRVVPRDRHGATPIRADDQPRGHPQQGPAPVPGGRRRRARLAPSPQAEDMPAAPAGRRRRHNRPEGRGRAEGRAGTLTGCRCSPVRGRTR